MEPFRGKRYPERKDFDAITAYRTSEVFDHLEPYRSFRETDSTGTVVLHHGLGNRLR